MCCESADHLDADPKPHKKCKSATTNIQTLYQCCGSVSGFDPEWIQIHGSLDPDYTKMNQKKIEKS
jgi:hypothetical protein